MLTARRLLIRAAPWTIALVFLHLAMLALIALSATIYATPPTGEALQMTVRPLPIDTKDANGVTGLLSIGHEFSGAVRIFAHNIVLAGGLLILVGFLARSAKRGAEAFSSETSADKSGEPSVSLGKRLMYLTGLKFRSQDAEVLVLAPGSIITPSLIHRAIRRKSSLLTDRDAVWVLGAFAVISLIRQMIFVGQNSASALGASQATFFDFLPGMAHGPIELTAFALPLAAVYVFWRRGELHRLTTILVPLVLTTLLLLVLGALVESYITPYTLHLVTGIPLVESDPCASDVCNVVY